MNTRDRIIAAAIAHCTSPMDNWTATQISDGCRKMLMQDECRGITDQEEIVKFVQFYAHHWKLGSIAERDRILAIDAIAAQLPPGYEASVRSAKFETRLTADEFAVQVLQAQRAFTHTTPGQHH
ncbi:MAG: hypothetical protein U1A72_19900 [Sulfuritalea sp.]|nr:hypothetical protein [Sulfuritalea sp.]